MRNEAMAVSESTRLQAPCRPSPAVIVVATQLLDAARQSLMRDGQEAARCISEAVDLLRAEAAVGRGDACNTGGLAAWQLKRVLQLFEKNFRDSVRVDQAAAAARLSVAHFTRAFGRAMGESPTAYLRRFRVERAQKLMILTDSSLAEIALDCGFADQAHFSRVFRQIVNTTPAAWRRERHGVTSSADSGWKGASAGRSL
jgi:AraC family transcriptional regulator